MPPQELGQSQLQEREILHQLLTKFSLSYHLGLQMHLQLPDGLKEP